MAESFEKENRRFTLRVSVMSGESGVPEKQQRTFLTVTRSADGKETDVLLPEADDVVDTGWVPEIVYRHDADADAMEIVIRPNMAGLKGGDKDDRRLPDTKEPPPAIETRGHPACDDALYLVTFTNREVRVNGFRLSKPNFNSENEMVFDFLFRNPNRRVDMAEIEKEIKRTLTKKLREIVRDLGFVRELRDLFFPDISKTSIRFVNPVTHADFEHRGLKAPGIKIL